MKKNVKRLLLGVLVGAMTLFAVVASGCSAQEKLDTWYNQLTCEHAKVEKVVGKEATCTEDGYTEYEVCKVCDKELGKKVIKATGHENITVIEGYAATCTTTGKTDGEYCNDCQKTVVEQKTIYALGHKRTYAKAEKETCTTDGHTSGWICGNDGCDYVYIGYEIIPATGHDYDEEHICVNCGDDGTISMKDIQVGVDLSGYAMRLTVSEEEFNEVFSQSGVYNYSPITLSIKGQNFEINTMAEAIAVAYNFNEQGRPADEEQLILGASSTGFVIPNGCIVEEVNVSGQYLDYFEFYYVGLPETDNEATPAATNDVESTAVSYAMNKRVMPVVGELQYGLIVTDEDSSVWTCLF